MIDKLRIQNFQKHKELEIEFSPTVTTILGPSDSGKSAILRAIRWCLTNQPQGTSFIRNGSHDISVHTSLDNYIITRERIENSNNHYFLDDGKHDQIFKAFGTGTPTQISSLANVQDINFQLQHDGPWWFCNSAGEVSRQINSIVDLAIIDRSLARADNNHRKALSASQVAQNRLSAAITTRDGISWVEDCKTAWDNVVALRRKWRKCSEIHHITSDLVRGVLDAMEQVDQAADKAAGTLDVESALQNLGEIQEQRIKVQSVLDTLENLPSLEKDLAQVESQLSEIDMCPLCEQPLRKTT